MDARTPPKGMPAYEPPPIDSVRMPQRRRTGPVLGFFGLVIVGIGAALFVADRRAEQKKKETIDGAFTDLSVCLLGEPSDAPATKFRAIQLAVAAEDLRSSKLPASELWPFRCNGPAQTLLRVLNQERRAKQGVEDLAWHADQIAKKALGSDVEQRVADWSSLVDGLYAKAKDEGVTVGTRAAIAPAPAPATPLLDAATLMKARPLSKRPIALSAIKTEIHRGRPLTFAVNDPSLDGGPRVCTVPEAGETATCAKLPETAAGGDPLLLSAREPGVAPVVSLGHASSLGAFALDDGRALLENEKFGWLLRRGDGSVVTLAYKNEYERKLRLSLVRADAPVKGALITLPGKVSDENLYYAAALVPGWALFRGANQQDEIRLFAQPIAADGALGAAREIGEIGSWYTDGPTPQFRSCHSGEALAVAIKDKYSWHVTIEKGGTFTVPALLAAPVTRMSCRGAEAVFVNPERERVQVGRCAHGICNYEVESLPQRKEGRAIADLDGQLALVDRPTPRAGVHLRIGPTKGLSAAPARPLFDDAFRDGRPIDQPWIQDFALENGGASAILFVNTLDGTYLVRITRDGAALPLDVDG
jgi:hypothetical protein